MEELGVHSGVETRGAVYVGNGGANAGGCAGDETVRLYPALEAGVGKIGPVGI